MAHSGRGGPGERGGGAERRDTAFGGAAAGEAAIELTTAQLGELADRAFYLHELMRAEQSDVAEGLQPTW